MLLRSFANHGRGRRRETVELGNTVVTAIATPGHAPAHHAYTVAHRRRGDEELANDAGKAGGSG